MVDERQWRLRIRSCPSHTLVNPDVVERVSTVAAGALRNSYAFFKHHVDEGIVEVERAATALHTEWKKESKRG